MAQPPQTLPADFFDKQPPSELPPDFFEKKAKARTPAETKEFLKRYAPILNQPGLARQLATGAGKQLLQDSVGHLDPVGPILEMKDAVQGKPHTPRGMAAVTAPSGEGEEAGGLFMQGAELLLPAPKMAQAGYEAYQGWKEGRAVSKAVKSERIKRLAKDALEGPKTGKGLKPPKSGGLAPQFDEGASRLPPRKGFTPPPDDPPPVPP